MPSRLLVPLFTIAVVVLGRTGCRAVLPVTGAVMLVGDPSTR